MQDCPSVEDLLPEEALSFLKGYQERMLKKENVEPEVKADFDPVLRFNQKKYQRLVQEFARKGLVRGLSSVKEEVGMFAVWKDKGRAQRLIIDARRANCHFAEPPPVSLMTSETRGSVFQLLGNSKFGYYASF